MITVPGRVLKSPLPVYKNVKIATPKFASWNMLTHKLNDARVVKNWSILELFPPSVNRENGPVKRMSPEQIGSF